MFGMDEKLAHELPFFVVKTKMEYCGMELPLEEDL